MGFKVRFSKRAFCSVFVCPRVSSMARKGSLTTATSLGSTFRGIGNSVRVLPDRKDWTFARRGFWKIHENPSRDDRLCLGPFGCSNGDSGSGRKRLGREDPSEKLLQLKCSRMIYACLVWVSTASSYAVGKEWLRL